MRLERRYTLMSEVVAVAMLQVHLSLCASLHVCTAASALRQKLHPLRLEVFADLQSAGGSYTQCTMASDITIQNFGHYIVINFDDGVQVSNVFNSKLISI
jgi:hypothetical protein